MSEKQIAPQRGTSAPAAAEQRRGDMAHEREFIDRRAVVAPEEKVFNNQDENQLLLKTAIEQSNESVIIMTARPEPSGLKIVYVNSAFTKMTGYAPEDVIGKTPRVLQGPETDPSLLSRSPERERKDLS